MEPHHDKAPRPSDRFHSPNMAVPPIAAHLIPTSERELREGISRANAFPRVEPKVVTPNLRELKTVVNPPPTPGLPRFFPRWTIYQP